MQSQTEECLEPSSRGGHGSQEPGSPACLALREGMVVKFCERAPEGDADQPWPTMLSDAQRCSALPNTAAGRTRLLQSTTRRVVHAAIMWRGLASGKVGPWWA
jgi:hypothetical protein